MAEGSALFSDEAGTVGDREKPPQRCGRGRRVEPIQRPPLWEWLAVGVVIWSLYLAACSCSAYIQVDWDSSHPVVGWRVLAFGWVLALLYPPACVPWSANFLLLGGWVAYLRGQARSAAICGVVAAVAGFTAFAMPRSEVPRLLVGYYLWQASLLIFAVASARRWWWHQAQFAPGGVSIAEPSR